MTLEYCCECESPTGRAGRGDGSLYIDDIGPLCEECWTLGQKILEEQKP